MTQSTRDEVTAVELAREAGIDPKTFRAALRRERFPWHRHNASWTALRGSPQHENMLRVLSRLNRK
jgi:hypothetical protein